jgi:hypothetical protein
MGGGCEEIGKLLLSVLEENEERLPGYAHGFGRDRCKGEDRKI